MQTVNINGKKSKKKQKEIFFKKEEIQKIKGL
jgi:hypothetical protein